MAHVKKDDEVVVLCGKYADKRGKVLEVNPKDKKVTVDGVNVVKRHISNVMLVCPKCGKPTRPAVVIDADKCKHRVCRKCHEQF